MTDTHQCSLIVKISLKHLYILHSSFYILHSTFFILHSSFYILHSTFYILHSSFFILHSSFFILHSTFFILHSSFIILHSSLSILLGNHPFLTRSLCSKSSCIDQNDEAPHTANNIDQVRLSIITDAIVLTIPINAKTHQHFTPK